MQFLIRAYDGPNMLEKRMEVRPRHLEGMSRLSEHIICAGGLLDEERFSARVCGRCFFLPSHRRHDSGTARRSQWGGRCAAVQGPGPSESEWRLHH